MLLYVGGVSSTAGTLESGVCSRSSHLARAALAASADRLLRFCSSVSSPDSSRASSASILRNKSSLEGWRNCASIAIGRFPLERHPKEEGDPGNLSVDELRIQAGVETDRAKLDVSSDRKI